MVAPDDERKVPAARARREARVKVTAALTALAALVVVPPLVLRPLADPAPLALPAGAAAGFCLALLRNSANAAGRDRLYSNGSRFVTAWTWTGRRTIDLRGMRRIRARQLTARTLARYVIVTDTAGVRLCFSDLDDISLIGRMLAEQARQRPRAEPVKISRLARQVLGIAWPDRALAAAWTAGSVALFTLTVFAPVVVIWLIERS